MKELTLKQKSNDIMEWNCCIVYQKGTIVRYEAELMIIGEYGVNSEPITIDEYARRNGLNEGKI